MVDRELFAAWLLSAVLAGHLVTLENVSTAEGNCLSRHCVELGQCDDFWDTDALANRLDERLVAIRDQLAPIAPVIQLVIDRSTILAESFHSMIRARATVATLIGCQLRSAPGQA